MNADLFVALFALACYAMLALGFWLLPRENWQIFATFPLRKQEDGSWQGWNLTWYGLIAASAYAIGLLLLFFLMGSTGVPHPVTGTLIGLLLMASVPASRWVARIVEGKRHTFTVGGAIFVGMLALPPALAITRATIGSYLNAPLPPAPLLAAMGVAYAIGEGLGRLACVSFGCCYGKPVDECGPRARRLFRRFHFNFRGATKKAAYAGGYEDRPLVPIQGITSLLYVSAGVAGLALFLHAHFTAATAVTFGVTLGWRVVSEVFRRDERGGGRLTAYQWMALVGIVCLPLASFLLPAAEGVRPRVGLALWSIWDPALLLTLRVTWLVIVLFMGRSSVTGATVSYHVRRERI